MSSRAKARFPQRARKARLRRSLPEANLAALGGQALRLLKAQGGGSAVLFLDFDADVLAVKLLRRDDRRWQGGPHRQSAAYQRRAAAFGAPSRSSAS